MQRKSHNKRIAGYTLIEVLVAITMLGFITLATTFALSTAIKAEQSSRRYAELMQELRGLTSVVRHDLTSAFASTGNPNTMFTSGGTAQGALITFTTLGSRVQMGQTDAQGNEITTVPQSNVSIVSYAFDESTSTLSRLVTNTPNADQLPLPGTDATVLSRKVRSISFEYYDPMTSAVKDTWQYFIDTTTNQLTANGDTTLPQSVMVTLELASDNGNSIQHTITVPILMSQPLPAGQKPATTTPGTPAQ